MTIENQQQTGVFVPNDTTPPQLGLGTFTPYNSQAMPLSLLLKQMLGNIEGIEIDFTSATFQGKEHAASYFGPLTLGPNTSFASSGVLLTSGDGAPARENTEMSFSFSNSDWLEVPYDDELDEDETVALEDQPSEFETEVIGEEQDEEIPEYYLEPNAESGDGQLTEIAQNAFEGAGVTYDAAVLEFSFKVTDPSIRSISLDLMFGSEEYPEFVDSSFVDIAAVMVNGTNYAYIDGDEKKPLSIVGATTEDGRFVDNFPWQWDENGDMLTTGEAPLPIEYNGITPKLTISIPLVELAEGEDSYHVRIGIADTGDDIYDSGLFVSNLQALTTSYEGTLVNKEASDDGEVMEAAGENTATKFTGGKGNDTMKGSTAADVYDVQQGGANTIQGDLANLANDTVVGFDADDTLNVADGKFSANDLVVTMGSAIIDIDNDGDGDNDGTVKLEGDFRKGVFVTETGTEGTDVRYQALNTTPDSVQLVASDDSEIDVTGDELVKLLGDTSDKHVTVDEGSSVMNLSAGTDVTLSGISVDDVQLLRDGTTLLILDQQGNTLVQMASKAVDDIGFDGDFSQLTFDDGTFMLAANSELQALGLFKLDGQESMASIENIDSVVLFDGDGDRLMGSQWLTKALTDEGSEMVTLAGVQNFENEPFL